MRIIARTDRAIVFDLSEECNFQGQTIGDLKLRLSAMPYIGIRPGDQRLQYDGVVLTDDMLLSDVLVDQSHVFILTKESDDLFCAPDDEEGAVGGMPVSITDDDLFDCDPGPSYSGARFGNSSDNVNDNDNDNVSGNGSGNSNGNPNPLWSPEGEYIADSNGSNVADVYDEEMELPSDLQCYYQRLLKADENVVNRIAAMGYHVSDVRAALKASFNNPDRAIEYLVDGLPNSFPSTPPPSYAGSSYSADFDVATPPEPSSPLLSSIGSGSGVYNPATMKDCEDIGECETKSHKHEGEYKDSVAKVASWAASATEITRSRDGLADGRSLSQLEESVEGHSLRDYPTDDAAGVAFSPNKTIIDEQRKEMENMTVDMSGDGDCVDSKHI